MNRWPRARSTARILFSALVAALLVSPVAVAQGSPVDGGAWSALGSNGAGDGAPQRVHALAVSGSDLYVGGYFDNAAGIPEADYVARWNGSAWSALGSNGSGTGRSTDCGPRPRGLRQRPLRRRRASPTPRASPRPTTSPGGTAAPGPPWARTAPATGRSNDPVYALAVSGSDLYVGRQFPNAAGIAEADYVARWDGSAWSALGSDGSGDGALDGAGLRPRGLRHATSTWAVGSPTPRASPRPTTSPGGTAAPGPPWARTAPATGRSTDAVAPSRSPAATSTWAGSSTTPRASPRPTTSPGGTAAPGRPWARTAPATGRSTAAV